MVKLNVALSTSHRIHLSAEQAVCECYPLGFSDIQVGTPHYNADTGALNTLREKLGLKYTVHAPFPAVKGFIANAAAADRKILDKSVDILLASLDNAKSIGAEVIVVHSAEPGFENSIESTVETFQTLSERAAGNNQIVCIENKMPAAKVGYSADDIRRILDDVGSGDLGVCFDTGHAIATLKSERKALEFFKSFSEHIRDVHIVPGTYEWDVATPPQMEPHFYRQIVQILDDVGYEGNLTIEAVSEIPDTEIVKGARYLRATIVEHIEKLLP
jgi:sugar phosphate isomerase/epimerase